jgi:carboxyl-terminal processing protease
MQPGNVELDETLDMKSGWGFSTITLMKIYRVTGKSVQQRGVTPDIILPDLYDFSEIGESYATGALMADSVVKKTYYTPLKALPRDDLKAKSVTRVEASEAFRLTRDCSRQLQGLKEKLDTVTLQWASYISLLETEAAVFRQFEQANSAPTEGFKILAHAFNQQRMQMDDYARQQNEIWIGNLSKDISLQEAFYIICDLTAAASAN